MIIPTFLLVAGSAQNASMADGLQGPHPYDVGKQKKEYQMMWTLKREDQNGALKKRKRKKNDTHHRGLHSILYQHLLG